MEHKDVVNMLDLSAMTVGAKFPVHLIRIMKGHPFIYRKKNEMRRFKGVKESKATSYISKVIK